MREARYMRLFLGPVIVVAKSYIVQDYSGEGLTKQNSSETLCLVPNGQSPITCLESLKTLSGNPSYADENKKFAVVLQEKL